MAEEKEEHPLEATIKALQRLKVRIEIIEKTLEQLPNALKEFSELTERVTNIEKLIQESSDKAAQNLKQFIDEVTTSEGDEKTEESEEAEEAEEEKTDE